MTVLQLGISWKDAIDVINNSNILEAKIVERNIRKNKKPEENLKGETLFIKRKNTKYTTVYRKNIKEEKASFLGRKIDINVIDYLNTNLISK